jgi:hypothetical protein
MQTYGAGSNWGSADRFTGQVCIHGSNRHRLLPPSSDSYVHRPSKLRKSTVVRTLRKPQVSGGPYVCGCLYFFLYSVQHNLKRKQVGDLGPQSQNKKPGESPYLSMLGAALWCTRVCPEIQYAVSLLAMFSAAPPSHHTLQGVEKCVSVPEKRKRNEPGLPLRPKGRSEVRDERFRWRIICR